MKHIWMILWLLTNNITAVSAQAVNEILTLSEAVSLECDSTKKTKLVTDRIIDPYAYGVYEVPCVRQSKPIIILIDESNRIGSVTLHAGLTDTPTSILDFFHVKLFRQDRTEAICGWWTQEFLNYNHSMRVNCKLMNEPFRSVAILPTKRTNQKMAANVRLTQRIPISEIEVVTKEYSTTVAFYGCYQTFEGEVSRYGGNCKDVCYDDNSVFASYRAEGKCMCGSKLPTTLLPTEDCYPECLSIFGFLCGGPNAFSIYIARAPHIYSLGCFEYREPDDAIPDRDLTIVKCIKKCSQEDKRFAYLVKGEYCNCEEIEPSGEAEPEDCNYNCSGEARNCGGEHSALVYAGCLSNRKESSCLDVYNCLDDDFDEYGRCQGLCEDGWKGPYCLSRELPVFTTTTTLTTQDLTTTEMQTTAAVTLAKTTEAPKPPKTEAITSTKGTTAAPEKVEPEPEEGGSSGAIIAGSVGLLVAAAVGTGIWYKATKKPKAPHGASAEPPPKPSPSQSAEAPTGE